MRIGFIGAGKVSFTLGKIFSENNIFVTGYYSRSKKSAIEAAKFTRSKFYKNKKEVIFDSDVIFLTVPDGEISKVFKEISRFKLNNKQICHCSGAMNTNEAFFNLEGTGAIGYSIHPLFPINNKYNSYKELKDAFFCLEGDEKAIGCWKLILENLGFKTKIILGKDKVRYHISCVIASNLMCALVQESLDLLKKCGFEEKEALEALAPLLKSNMEHIVQGGTTKALTGPIERNDIETIKKHLFYLKKEDQKEIYTTLSKKLIELAKIKHPENSYDEVKNIL